MEGTIEPPVKKACFGENGDEALAQALAARFPSATNVAANNIWLGVFEAFL